MGFQDLRARGWSIADPTFAISLADAPRGRPDRARTEWAGLHMRRESADVQGYEGPQREPLRLAA